MSMGYNLACSVFLWVCLFVPLVGGVTIVEGFDGGSVVLPCTLTPNGDLAWKQQELILIKPATGAVIISEGLYKGDVSLVNGDDLRISPLRKNRDGAGDGGGGGDQVFECVYTGGGTQQIQLRLLARITGVGINEAMDGKVTVTAGTPITLTCSVTGVPDPSPSYTWSIGDVTANGLASKSFTFTPKKSMKTIKCTATNSYSNGSVLSVKEAAATFNVLSKITDVSISETSKGIVTVEAGISITLTCSATGDPNPLPSYTWSVNCASGNGQTSSSCTFKPDKFMKTIKCTATNKYSNGSVLSVKEVTATFNLLSRITGVSIPEAVDGKITVTVGTIKALTCSVTGDPNPPPSYIWRVDGNIIIGQTSSSYKFTPDKSKKTITCTATNIYPTGVVFSEKETMATLNILYLDPPTIPIPSASITVIENNTVTLPFLAEGNPQPSYQWTYNTKVVSQSADYTKENVQRSAAGEYTCRVINTVRRFDRTTKLIVQYPPHVTVSYDKATHTLTCTTEGVPRNNSFSAWGHRLDGKLLQTLGTQSSGSTATLKLPDTLTYEDTGYYVCQVSNGIKSLQTEQLLVTPQCPAIFENQSLVLNLTRGVTKMVSLRFYTYSDTPNVTVVWKKSGQSTVLTSHREETGSVGLIIHGHIVSKKGTVTILTLENVTQSDAGNYIVTVTNDINGVPQSSHTSFLVNIAVMINSNQKSTQPPGVEVAPIAGGAAGAVILILLIVIVIIVVRRRSVSSKNTDTKTKKPKKSNRKDEDRDNEAFSDDRWKQPDAEIAVNDLYGTFPGVPQRNGYKKPDSLKPDTETRTKEPKFNSENDVGRETEAFSGDRWKQPDAEIAVNDLYGSFSGVPQGIRHETVPATNKPMKAKKPQPKPKVKLENSSRAAGDTGQPSKSRRLNYEDVEFDKTEEKPKFHPRESPVAYADIDFFRKNSPGVAVENEQTSGGRSLNYEQVEFDSTKGKPKLDPQDPPVTYADINFTQKIRDQKSDCHPVINDVASVEGTRTDDKTQHAIADNTANDLLESEMPTGMLPPRDVKPPRPGKKPTQSRKPFPTKKPLPKPSPTEMG